MELHLQILKALGPSLLKSHSLNVSIGLLIRLCAHTIIFVLLIIDEEKIFKLCNQVG